MEHCEKTTCSMPNWRFVFAQQQQSPSEGDSGSPSLVHAPGMAWRLGASHFRRAPRWVVRRSRHSHAEAFWRLLTHRRNHCGLKKARFASSLVAWLPFKCRERRKRWRHYVWTHEPRLVGTAQAPLPDPCRACRPSVSLNSWQETSTWNPLT